MPTSSSAFLRTSFFERPLSWWRCLFLVTLLAPMRSPLHEKIGMVYYGGAVWFASQDYGFGVRNLCQPPRWTEILRRVVTSTIGSFPNLFGRTWEWISWAYMARGRNNLPWLDRAHLPGRNVLRGRNCSQKRVRKASIPRDGMQKRSENQRWHVRWTLMYWYTLAW